MINDDCIYNWVDDWLLEGDFEAVDLFLTGLADPLILKDSTLLVLLTATLPAAEELEKRANFYERAEAELIKRNGPEKAEQLLQGLKGNPRE